MDSKVMNRKLLAMLARQEQGKPPHRQVSFVEPWKNRSMSKRPLNGARAQNILGGHTEKLIGEHCGTLGKLARGAQRLKLGYRDMVIGTHRDVFQNALRH